MAAGTKRNSLHQEGLRRLWNISEGVTDEEKKRILGEFMNMLRILGYDIEYRIMLLRGILKMRKAEEDDIKAGKKKRFRTRDEIKEQKAAKGGRYANTWYLRGEYKSVL